MCPRFVDGRDVAAAHGKEMPMRRASLLVVPLLAAGVPAHEPAPQPRSSGSVVVLEKAKVLTGDGWQDDVTLLVVDGRVTSIGHEVAAPAGGERIDVAGLTVVPGFIDAFAELTVDREAPAPLLPKSDGAAQDYGRAAYAETAEASRRGLRPELRARALLTAPTVEALDKLRQAGFTAQLVSPIDGYLAGQACVVELANAPPRRTVLREPGVLLLKFRGGGGGGGGPPGAPGQRRARDEGDFGYPSTLMGALAHLRQAFLDAGHLTRWREAHRASPATVARPPDDECLETLERALAGELRVAFAVDRENDVRRALQLAAEFKLSPLIVGGREAWKCADLLKAAKTPVIASLAFADAPERKGAKLKKPEAKKDEAKKEEAKPEEKPADAAKPPEEKAAEAKPAEVPPLDEKLAESWEVADPVLAEPLELYLERKSQWEDDVRNVEHLLAAGVEVALTMRGSSGPPDFFGDLRVAIEKGLAQEAALAALTTTPARLFGVEPELGSIRVGGPAHFFVVEGDLAAKERTVRHVFIGDEHVAYAAKPKDEKKDGAGRGGRGRRGGDDAPPAGPGGTPTLDLTGTWELRGEGAGGFKSTLTLKQEGSALTGKLESEMGAADVSSGKLDGDQFTVAITAEFQGRKFDFELTGSATKDELKGKFATPFGEPTAFTATRKPDGSAPRNERSGSEDDWGHSEGCGCGAHPEDRR
jgi:imidazolonepropionase-like amidohydrolase